MGINDIVYIGKLMWNLVRNAKEFARLQEERPGILAQIEALKIENTSLRLAYDALKDAKPTAVQILEPPKVAGKNPKDKWAVPEGYEAFSPQPGVTVYRFCPPADSTASEHFLCPRCLHIWGDKLILQFRNSSMDTAQCPKCRTIYRFKPGKWSFF